MTIRLLNILFTEGKVSKDNMISFLKTIREATNLSDEDAAKIAASRIQASKPKSRMYYKIEASREIGGSKKVDARSFLSSKLRVCRGSVYQYLIS